MRYFEAKLIEYIENGKFELRTVLTALLSKYSDEEIEQLVKENYKDFAKNSPGFSSLDNIIDRDLNIEYIESLRGTK